MTEKITYVDFVAKQRLESAPNLSPKVRAKGRMALTRWLRPTIRVLEDLPPPTIDEAVNAALEAYGARINHAPIDRPTSPTTTEEVLQLNAIAREVFDSLPSELKPEARQRIQELTWSTKELNKEI